MRLIVKMQSIKICSEQNGIASAIRQNRRKLIPALDVGNGFSSRSLPFIFAIFCSLLLYFDLANKVFCSVHRVDNFQTFAVIDMIFLQLENERRMPRDDHGDCCVYFQTKK